MTELEKLERISIYKSLNLTQDEIELRLNKDEHIDSDPFWQLIRDQKFRKIDEIPDEEWDTEYLEDEIYRQAVNLNESNKSLGDIGPGDVVIVNSFLNISQDKYINNRTHHFVIVSDSGNNNVKKKTFFGFGLSSQLEHSNKLNPKESGHIFIKDYDSIFQNNKFSSHKSLYINLTDISEVSYNDIVTKVGHISPDFSQFIMNTKQKINNKEDTSTIYWEE